MSTDTIGLVSVDYRSMCGDISIQNKEEVKVDFITKKEMAATGGQTSRTLQSSIRCTSFARHRECKRSPKSL